MVADIPEQSSPDKGQQRLTYAQIAEQLHISGDAARVLVRRRGWFRIIPNKRGQPTVVVVPAEDLASEQERRTHLPNAGGTSPDSGRSDLASAFPLLLSRLIEAERRADHAERKAEEAAVRLADAEAVAIAAQNDANADRARADRAEDDRRAAEGRADRLEQDLAAARVIAQAAQRGAQEAVAQARAETKTAQEAAEALRQAEEARKARGRWARLRAAWRGR
jgi:hypothetical protein